VKNASAKASKTISKTRWLQIIKTCRYIVFIFVDKAVEEIKTRNVPDELKGKVVGTKTIC
jgi:hypothetical protein